MKIKLFMFGALMVFGMLMFCVEAKAVTSSPTSSPAPSPSQTTPPEVNEVKLENPLTIGTDVTTIIGTIINGVLGVMGGIVLLMVVFGAGTWLTSAGNPEKVKAGSQTMLWAILGAIITMASYIILSNIMKLISTNN